MNIHIRALLPEDQPVWLRMRQALWPDCSVERHSLEVEQLVASKETLVLMALDESERPCGFAEISIRRDHVDGAASVPTAYLEGWYVDPAVRGGGVGRRLLEAAERWALERGLQELASDVELENARGIATHLACGFKETCRAVHFIKTIRLPLE